MIVLYTCALVAVTLLPFAIRMSGVLYLAAALALGGVFLAYTVQLYRDYSDRARAGDVQVLDLLSRGAVLGAAHRSLLAMMRRTASQPRRCSWRSRWRSAGCGRGGPQVQGLRRHRLGVRPRFRAHRPHRQAAHARRFPRQGRRAVLRLHAMPRRLSDDARDARGGDEAPRTGCARTCRCSS